ncbi:uncharacterized protein LOC129890475 [Solanum dulcamara]|uniref:uncharacterized protein LOC129890475 n=1 Tax=Solanum dulcamara TaxID=45834 RepID=UPI00248596F8|nr:uncharacterized protein LOC129890475 [Solanum dulcamara]
MTSVDLRPTFIEEIKAKQFEDVNLNAIKENVLMGKAQDVVLDAGRVLNFRRRICVPWVDGIIQKVLSESHGLLQRMSIPKWKWERISMDFVVGLPETLGKYDSIWVVIDKLIKSAHFIPVRVDYNSQQLA